MTQGVRFSAEEARFTSCQCSDSNYSDFYGGKGYSEDGFASELYYIDSDSPKTVETVGYFPSRDQFCECAWPRGGVVLVSEDLDHRIGRIFGRNAPGSVSEPSKCILAPHPAYKP